MDIKNFERAAHYQSKYIALKDSIYNEGFTTRMMQAEVEHLEKINAAKTEAQREVIALNGIIIERQIALNIAIVFLALAAMTFSFMIYVNYKRKKTLSLLLSRKVNERTHQLELNRNELTATLHERDLGFGRVLAQINEVVSTIRGLCFAGKLATNGTETQTFFDQIDKTLTALPIAHWRGAGKGQSQD